MLTRTADPKGALYDRERDGADNVIQILTW